MSRVFIGASLGLMIAIAAACASSSSSAPTGCVPAFGACGSTDACWPISATPTFGCVTAGKGAFGAPCENTLGVASCGANMACDELPSGEGACTFYCDGTNKCPSGYECHATVAGSSAGDGGVTLLVCRIGGDGGILGIDNSGDGGGGSGGSLDAAYPDAMELQK